jgi:hypothetical protein
MTPNGQKPMVTCRHESLCSAPSGRLAARPDPSEPVAVRFASLCVRLRPSPSDAPQSCTKLVRLLYKRVGGVVQLFVRRRPATLEGRKMNKTSTKMNTPGGGGGVQKRKTPPSAGRACCGSVSVASVCSCSTPGKIVKIGELADFRLMRPRCTNHLRKSKSAYADFW